MMITPIRTVEQGLQKAFKIIGNDAEIAVIPEGPLVVPVLEG
jgi:nickel-dependent lactate racemase